MWCSASFVMPFFLLMACMPSGPGCMQGWKTWKCFAESIATLWKHIELFICNFSGPFWEDGIPCSWPDKLDDNFPDGIWRVLLRNPLLSRGPNENCSFSIPTIPAPSISWPSTPGHRGAQVRGHGQMWTRRGMLDMVSYMSGHCYVQGSVQHMVTQSCNAIDKCGAHLATLTPPGIVLPLPCHPLPAPLDMIDDLLKCPSQGPVFELVAK